MTEKLMQNDVAQQRALIVKGVIGWIAAVIFIIGGWQLSWVGVFASLPFLGVTAVLLSTIYFIDHYDFFNELHSGHEVKKKSNIEEPSAEELEDHLAFLLKKVHKSTAQSRAKEEDERFQRDLADSLSEDGSSSESDDELEPDLLGGKRVHFSKIIKEVRLYNPEGAPSPQKVKRKKLPLLPISHREKIQTLPALGARVQSGAHDADYAFKNSPGLAFLISNLQQLGLDFKIQAVTESPDQKVPGSSYVHFRVNVSRLPEHYLLPIAFTQQLVPDRLLADTVITYKKNPYQMFVIQIKAPVDLRARQASLVRMYEMLIQLFSQQAPLLEQLSFACYSQLVGLWCSAPKALIYKPESRSDRSTVEQRTPVPLLASLDHFVTTMMRVTRDHDPCPSRGHEGLSLTEPESISQLLPGNPPRQQQPDEICCPAVQLVCNALKRAGYEAGVNSPSRKLRIKTPNSPSNYFDLDFSAREGYKVLPVAFIQQLVPDDRIREAQAKGIAPFVTHIIQVREKGDLKTFERDMIQCLRTPFLADQDTVGSSHNSLLSGTTFYVQSLHAQWRSVPEARVFDASFVLPSYDLVDGPRVRWPLLQSQADFNLAMRRASEHHAVPMDARYPSYKDESKLTYFV